MDSPHLNQMVIKFIPYVAQIEIEQITFCFLKFTILYRKLRLLRLNGAVLQIVCNV